MNSEVIVLGMDLGKIEKKIIVSCQALEDEPLHGRGIMVLMAKAAIMGGASAIRANGTQDIEDIKAAFDIPLIGLNREMMKCIVLLSDRKNGLNRWLSRSL